MATKNRRAQIELSASADGVKKGVGEAKKSIAEIGPAAKAAGEQASSGLAKVGDGGDAAARKLEQSTKSLIGSIQRQTAAFDAGSRGSARYFEVLAQQRGVPVSVLKPYLDQLDAVAAKQKLVAQQAQRIPNLTTSLGATAFSKPLPAGLTTSLGATGFGEIPAAAAKATAAVASFEKTFGAAGLTAKQTSAALRQVPAQLTDIVVSLQGGQAPLTVLLQQGGQLKDVFGGIGPAARALGSYVLGLVNPFTLAAAAVASLGAAYFVGTKRQDEFAKSLILSGNAVGSTVSELQEMAVSISQSFGNIGQASSALAKFAADGNVPAQSLEKITTAAIRLETLGGQAIDKTVEQFASLAKDPLQAALKLNESTRFLTRSVYEQIKALTDQGQAVEAARVAQEAYFNATESRGRELEDRLGNIERAWLGVKNATLGALNAVVGFVAPSAGQEIQQARENLKELERIRAAAIERGGTPTEAFERRLQQQRDLIDGYNLQEQVTKNIAETEKKGRESLQARLDAEATLKRNVTDRGVLLKKELDLINSINKRGGYNSEQEFQSAIAGARERFKPPKGPASQERAIDRSQLAFDLSAIEGEKNRLVGIYSDAERILETLRTNGLVGERDYYESKRQFLELETGAKEKALLDEIERREKETFSGKTAVQDAKNNAKEIAEAEAKLAILRASSSAKFAELLVNQEGALKRVQLAYITARQAAEDYLSSQQRQQQRSLDSFGQGAKQRAFNEGISRVEDDFNSQRRDLENQRARLEFEGKFTEEAQKQYRQQLEIINEFQAKSIRSFEDYWNKLEQMQGNASLGATEATKNYIDGANDIARNTADLFNNTFQNAEDALTDFLTTGKLNYKSFATSIVADINRIIVRQVIANQLAKSIGVIGDSGSSFGSILQSLVGGIAGRASGGPVERGRLYEVNEKKNGPGELLNVGGRQYLMASQSGYVTPSSTAPSGAAKVVNVVNNFMLSGRPDARTQSQIAVSAGRGIQHAMARNT